MPDHVYPLVAIRDDGTTITASTLREAAALNRLRPGAYHVRGISYIAAICQGEPVHRETVLRNEWIVRDDHGAVVLHEDLPRSDAPRSGWLRRRLLEARGAANRGLPIPGTGRRHRYSAGFRAFRKNMAMRSAEAALADDLEDWEVGHLNVGRSRRHDLPQVCDDVAWRAGRRSWKNTRATQWRG